MRCFFLFSLLTYKGKSVSNAVLLHVLWNFIMVTDLLHIGVQESERALFTISIPSGNIAITGGGFGVEASAAAIIGYLLVCAAAVFLPPALYHAQKRDSAE